MSIKKIFASLFAVLLCVSTIIAIDCNHVMSSSAENVDLDSFLVTKYTDKDVLKWEKTAIYYKNVYGGGIDFGMSIIIDDKFNEDIYNADPAKYGFVKNDYFGFKFTNSGYKTAYIGFTDKGLKYLENMSNTDYSYFVNKLYMNIIDAGELYDYNMIGGVMPENTPVTYSYPGDINMDQELNLADLNLMRRVLAKCDEGRVFPLAGSFHVTFAPPYAENCRITALDVLYVRKTISGSLEMDWPIVLNYE